MIESLEPRQIPKKIPLEERFSDPEKKQKLAELRAYAEEIEHKLMEAYGPAPSAGRMEDAFDHIQQELVDIANNASEFAEQWREFKVGAAMLVFRKTASLSENPWKILFNANTKPMQHDAKWCAECYLLDQVERSETLRVLALGVAGDLQVDDASKAKQITLLPCSDLCTPRLLRTSRDNPQLLPPKTPVITAVRNQTWRRKYFNLEDLPRLHRLPDAVDIDPV